MLMVATRSHAQDQPPLQGAPSAPPATTIKWMSPANLPSTRMAGVDITYASKHQPAYPREAIRNHEEGTVLVLTHVGVDGRALDTKIERSSGYPDLDEAAQTVVAGWKFSSAYKDNQPVVSWIRIPVNFQLPKAAVKQ